MRPVQIDLAREDARPYFLWDEDTTLGELREYLASRDPAVSGLYTARVLREAKYEDVWRLVSPREVADRWEWARPHLGRARPLWEHLLSVWKRHGLVP